MGRMNETVPEWPSRVSREQARDAKLRAREFEQCLKELAKSSGWKFANGTLFRIEGDWFVDVVPRLLWQRGVVARLRAKPLSVDPVFWRIVGLEENERLPLSFRANGAWVLRAPSREAHIDAEERDPAKLAAATVVRAADYAAEVRSSPTESLIGEIEGLGDRSKHFAALEVCLRIALGDLEGALRLCITAEDGSSGGYQTGDKGFFEQARDWISIRHKSDAL